MADTNIEWADKVLNPVAGCTIADIDAMKDAAKRKAPTVYFVNSMSDLFHRSVPFDFIDQVWEIMWHASRHTFIILTKRPERMLKYVSQRARNKDFGWVESKRTPLAPGTVLHFDTITMRGICGYQGGSEQREWVCTHPWNEQRGEENSCGNYECPIAYTIDEKKELEEIGVAGEYEYNEEGYTEESTDWMSLHSRPRHAAAANVILGFSAGTQKRLASGMRVFRSLREHLGPYFRLCASLEPLLERVTFKIPYYDRYDREDGKPESHIYNSLTGYKYGGPGDFTHNILDWVILGGESGAGARPMHPDWARSVRDECQAVGTKFFFKQWGEYLEEQEAMKLFGHDMLDRNFWKPWSHGTASLERIRRFNRDGSILYPKGSGHEDGNETVTVLRVGKSAAGRQLDGREWSEKPDIYGRKIEVPA